MRLTIFHHIKLRQLSALITYYVMPYEIIIKGDCNIESKYSKMQALINHGICCKHDQNRILNKKITCVCLEENWKL